MDGQGVGTTSPRRRRTLLVLQLPLVELLFYKASDLLTGRRFALHTFDPKPMPELLINVERDFLHARDSTLCRIREWSITHSGLTYQKTLASFSTSATCGHPA
jgi:hypothetical protein